ncbi:hypothetical protein PZ61_0202990 [Streptomyces sp. MNU77]|uniref:hypothetical protein n=1 Tax=Streptomyces sp. MNU77 TaxID=1573406 RepID=UPI0005E4BF47|nr:hypothetical protein [Streptomyces sp. MNU77]OLO29560.1 hypothetical protein PZ61_0202990 [Streptomyces sp. MNU77]
MLTGSLFCQDTGWLQCLLESHEPLKAAAMTLASDSLDRVLEDGTEAVNGVPYSPQLGSLPPDVN